MVAKDALLVVKNASFLSWEYCFSEVDEHFRVEGASGIKSWENFYLQASLC